MVPKSEWVLFLPGDNQFPVSNLLKFLKLKDDYDYILGIRKDRQDMIHRILYANIYSWLVSSLSGFKVTDVNSIVFFRSEIFDKINLKGNSGFVHAEFFIRSAKANFRMVEMEVLHQEREFGKGSGAKFTVALRIFRDLFLYLAGKL